MNEEIIKVGNIIKRSSSYGEYYFNLEIQTPKFKTNKIIFGWKIKEIKNLRNKYLKEIFKNE